MHMTGCDVLYLTMFVYISQYDVHGNTRGMGCRSPLYTMTRLLW